MADQAPASKRQKVLEQTAPGQSRTADSPFHPTLLDPANVDRLRQAHDKSNPYKHAVIDKLFDEAFLKRARQEITEQLSFREKETDICELAFPSLLPPPNPLVACADRDLTQTDKVPVQPALRTLAGTRPADAPHRRSTKPAT